MNKDKTIKDLKERNSKLDLQRFQNEVRYNATLRKNEELQQRIDKVLDFINAWKDNKTELEVSMLDLLQIEDILRGEEDGKA